MRARHSWLEAHIIVNNVRTATLQHRHRPMTTYTGHREHTSRDDLHLAEIVFNVQAMTRRTFIPEQVGRASILSPELGLEFSSLVDSDNDSAVASLTPDISTVSHALLVNRGYSFSEPLVLPERFFFNIRDRLSHVEIERRSDGGQLLQGGFLVVGSLITPAEVAAWGGGIPPSLGGLVGYVCVWVCV